jgi:hypothetical protein
MPDIRGVGEYEVTVVEDQPATIEVGGDDRVDLPRHNVAHDYEAQILARESDFGEREIFRNGIVFAISAPRNECRKRRQPNVGAAELGHIAHGTDREIDARPADLDNRKKSLGRWRASRGRRAAMRDGPQLLTDLGFDASPLARQLAVGGTDYGLPKRFGVSRCWRMPAGVQDRSRDVERRKPGAVRWPKSRRAGAKPSQSWFVGEQGNSRRRRLRSDRRVRNRRDPTGR